MRRPKKKYPKGFGAVMILLTVLLCGFLAYLVAEPYLPVQGVTNARGDEVFSVPEGCYFMMGDNRTGSDDSRFWRDPYVPEEAVRAKVLLIISPFRDSSWRGIRVVG